MIDVQEKKKKIIEFLKTSGPSLPVQVARAIQMDPVFASAILSELLGTKDIKTSHMKIGASPLYLLPGQEEKLEEKTENLKSIERETQEKLKSKKVIVDENEEPATRVALRNIKDFAIPFKFQDKITWKYAFTPQEEVNKILFQKEEKEVVEPEEKEKVAPGEKITHEGEKEEEPEIKSQTPDSEEEEIPKAWEVKKEEIKQAKENSKKIESIFGKTKEEVKEKNNPRKTFLEEVEQFLKNKNTSIKAIEEVDKKKVIATVISNEKSSMLFAFNKIRINEAELLKCYKTADKKGLPYQIIINGILTKKLTDTINAYQKLIKVSKLED